MSSVVSITSQGQLTIPMKIRKELGIKGSVKAVVKEVGGKLIVEPKTDFWSLEGSMKSKVKLTDKQLTNARKKFAKEWSEER